MSAILSTGNNNLIPWIATETGIVTSTGIIVPPNSYYLVQNGNLQSMPQSELHPSSTTTPNIIYCTKSLDDYVLSYDCQNIQEYQMFGKNAPVYNSNVADLSTRLIYSSSGNVELNSLPIARNDYPTITFINFTQSAPTTVNSMYTVVIDPAYEEYVISSRSSFIATKTNGQFLVTLVFIMKAIPGSSDTTVNVPITLKNGNTTVRFYTSNRFYTQTLYRPLIR